MLFNFFMFYYYKYSMYNMMSFVYQLQMFMLIPLMGVDVGEDIIDFYRYLHELLFSWEFLPNNIVFLGLENLFSRFHYVQPSWYLRLLYIDSGSSLMNMYDLIFVAALLLTLFLLVLPFNICTAAEEPDSNRAKFFKSARDFILTRLFVKLILVSFVFILICTVSEITHFKRITEGFTSYLASCII